MEKNQKLEFPLLKKEDIEIRVGQVKKDKDGSVKGFSLLLYKTARTDANYLDEIVGQFNWQKRFYALKDVVYCSLGVCNNGQWIWKDDCGKETQVESEKGESSDAFKRAGFAWGIGRELYTSPFIWIDGKDFTPYDHFEVSEITYNDKRQIIGLTIACKGKIAFTNIKAKEKDKAVIKPVEKITPKTNDKPLQETLAALERNHINIKGVAIYFKKEVDDLTNSDLLQAIALKKGKLNNGNE